MFGCPEVRGHGHTLSRAAVISKAGPQRNCLWIFQVFTSWTNLEQHRFPMRKRGETLFSVLRTTSQNFPGQKQFLSAYMLAEPWRRDVANDLQLLRPACAIFLNVLKATGLFLLQDSKNATHIFYRTYSCNMGLMTVLPLVWASNISVYKYGSRE